MSNIKLHFKTSTFYSDPALFSTSPLRTTTTLRAETLLHRWKCGCGASRSKTFHHLTSTYKLRGKWCAPPLLYLNAVRTSSACVRDAKTQFHTSASHLVTTPGQSSWGLVVDLQVMNTIALVQYSVATRLWELTAGSLQKAEAQQLMADPFWSTWERNWVCLFFFFSSKIKRGGIKCENRVLGLS